MTVTGELVAATRESEESPCGAVKIFDTKKHETSSKTFIFVILTFCPFVDFALAALRLQLIKLCDSHQLICSPK